MTDRFSDRAGSFTGPATLGFAVTPHDTNELAEVTRALYVGSGGDLVVDLIAGDTMTFKAVPTGTLLPLRVRKVRTASTASHIVALS